MHAHHAKAKRNFFSFISVAKYLSWKREQNLQIQMMEVYVCVCLHVISHYVVKWNKKKWNVDSLLPQV